jgi:hypothetical protein
MACESRAVNPSRKNCRFACREKFNPKPLPKMGAGIYLDCFGPPAFAASMIVLPADKDLL